MTNTYILAIDQGTSSTKTIVFDTAANVIAKANQPLKTYYLPGGQVEQDPEAIYQNVLDSVTTCLQAFTAMGHSVADIKSCGISNQRETFVVWDGNGKPLYNAVVWQCKRSIDICQQLQAAGLEALIQRKTGLIIDPYFSGTKLMWLQQQHAATRQAISSGNAYFGTIDTWLLYKLSGGKNYCTDYTNASRTLLFNLETLQWDGQLIDAFGLKRIQLPALQPSAGYFGNTSFNGLLPAPIPITAMIGDSHAAAFGEGCFEPGTAKATLGTGCSVLLNIGSKAVASASGMVTTICWSTKEQVMYALEGVIVTCGATIEWLKNELGLFTNSGQTEAMALSVPDNNGVYLVPAFSGLGAPHWDMNRKALIKGLTFDCNKNHIVRAALESIPYQVKDVAAAMEKDTGIQLAALMVNGGITANTFVMEFLADLLGCRVMNGTQPDVSALGAALLSALGAQLVHSLDSIRQLTSRKAAVQQGKYQAAMAGYYKGWQQAVNTP
jgi:glycerol kinase